MTPVRVALVTQWYPPEPVHQPAWIARALSAAGARVEVLTGVPNYPSGVVQPGYRAVSVHTEVVDGITVRRTPLYPDHGSSAVKRITNYLSWSLSSAVLGLGRLREADVTLVYSSPATAALPAMVARRLFGVPYVLLIQDVWPDSIYAAGFLRGAVGRIARGAMERFVGLTYRWASAVVVISPGMIDLLQSRGVPRHKLELVYNWVAEDDVRTPGAHSDLPRDWPEGEGRTVLYAGNHGVAQGLEVAVRAAASAKSDGVQLVMVGDGVDKDRLRNIVRDEGITNVHMLSSRPREQIGPLVARADAQLVCLTDEPLFAVTMPSKLQACLAAGKPAIVSAPGDAAAVVDDARAGLAARAGDAESLTQAFSKLASLSEQELSLMGNRAYDYYRTHMGERVGVRRLMSVLQGAIENRSSVPGQAAESAEASS